MNISLVSKLLLVDLLTCDYNYKSSHNGLANLFRRLRRSLHFSSPFSFLFLLLFYFFIISLVCHREPIVKYLAIPSTKFILSSSSILIIIIPQNKLFKEFMWTFINRVED